MSMCVVASGDIHNVLNLVFTVYVRVLGQGTSNSKVTASLLPQLTLLAGVTIS
jgi:hypothetical protein